MARCYRDSPRYVEIHVSAYHYLHTIFQYRKSDYDRQRYTTGMSHSGKRRRETLDHGESRRICHLISRVTRQVREQYPVAWTKSNNPRQVWYDAWPLFFAFPFPPSLTLSFSLCILSYNGSTIKRFLPSQSSCTWPLQQCASRTPLLIVGH